jgi:hypothetical protein
MPSDAIKITYEQWQDIVSNHGLRKWDGTNVVEFVQPPPEPVIPDRVSRRQFRRKLASVEAWIAQQDAETQMAIRMQRHSYAPTRGCRTDSPLSDSRLNRSRRVLYGGVCSVGGSANIVTAVM